MSNDVSLRCDINHRSYLIGKAEGLKEGRREAIKEILEMRQICHKEDFDLFDDWWVIDCKNVMRLYLNDETSSDQEIEDKLKELLESEEK